MGKKYKDENKARRRGYKNPPEEHQFKKGQSGNPKGRPKGSKNLANLYMDILEEEVVAKDGGKQKKMTKQEALVRRDFSDALNKGKDKAIERIHQYAPKNEDEEKRYTLLEWVETWDWGALSIEEMEVVEKLFKRFGKIDDKEGKT